MPKISIIVPVYNVEKFLPRCLDSILAQTFRDWECLMIDDGSIDSSGAICDEYASIDRRFKVFHKKNGGVSSARNYGLDVSSGDYIIFIDADDIWNSPICIEDLIETTTRFKTEITRFDYVAIDEECHKIYDSPMYKQRKSYSNKVLSNETFLSEVIRNEFFCPLLLIQKSLIGKLRFNEGQKFLEDMDFIVRLLPKAERCFYVDRTYYGYRKLRDSASCRGGLKNIQDSFDMCYSFNRYAENVESPVLRDDYIWYSVMMYVWTMTSISYNEFSVSRKGALKKLNSQIRLLHKNVLLWAKQYGGDKLIPNTVRLPSGLMSCLLALKLRLIKIIRLVDVK